MSELKQRIRHLIGKLGQFKYTFFVLLFGIALMCIPFDIFTEREENVNETITHEFDLEARLRSILALIDGVGDVEILLSPETDMSHTYQENIQSRVTSDTQEQERETVILSESGREVPLETAAAYPTYRGALVICTGADRASVKLAVIQAVSGVTGLSSDHIAVIKMRGK